MTSTWTTCTSGSVSAIDVPIERRRCNENVDGLKLTAAATEGALVYMSLASAFLGILGSLQGRLRMMDGWWLIVLMPGDNIKGEGDE